LQKSGKVEYNHTPLLKRITKEIKVNSFAYVIVFLALIHFSIFKAFPFISSLVLSFLRFRFIGQSEFVGLNNWKMLFTDPIMWRSLWNTILFTLYYVVPTMVLGLVLALLINAKIRGTKFFRVIYFLPVVTSFVVLASIWKWIFISQPDGLANTFLHLFGLPTQHFFDNTVLSLLVLAGLSLFKVCGTIMIYYFGGLKQIPDYMYEAADIDGAGLFRKFFSLTLPMLQPTTFYVAIMTTVGSFQIFDSAYLLTGGGPDYATNTVVFYIYQKAFVNLNFGYASALSFILFFIIFGISFLQKKLIGKDVSYF
jgi:multiple sugar transport system permease protein